MNKQNRRAIGFLLAGGWLAIAFLNLLLLPEWEHPEISVAAITVGVVMAGAELVRSVE